MDTLEFQSTSHPLIAAAFTCLCPNFKKKDHWSPFLLYVKKKKEKNVTGDNGKEIAAMCNAVHRAVNFLHQFIWQEETFFCVEWITDAWETSIIRPKSDRTWVGPMLDCLAEIDPDLTVQWNMTTYSIAKLKEQFAPQEELAVK